MYGNLYAEQRDWGNAYAKWGAAAAEGPDGYIPAAGGIGIIPDQWNMTALEMMYYYRNHEPHYGRVVLTESQDTATLVAYNVFNPNSFGVWMFWTLENCANISTQLACSNTNWTEYQGVDADSTLDDVVELTPLNPNQPFSATVRWATYPSVGSYGPANPPPFNAAKSRVIELAFPPRIR